MPNHVKNIVKTLNPETLKGLKSDTSDFDFNEVRRLPKDLEKSNGRVFEGTFVEYVLEVNKQLRFETVTSLGVQLPLTSEMETTYQAKYGGVYWYHWAIDNWGTKWNAYNIYTISDTEVHFDTAWATPRPLMRALSEKYPDEEFTIWYCDEDFGHNVGRYTLVDGYEEVNYRPDGGSNEAYELAMEIRPDYKDYVKYHDDTYKWIDCMSKIKMIDKIKEVDDRINTDVSNSVLEEIYNQKIINNDTYYIIE